MKNKINFLTNLLMSVESRGRLDIVSTLSRSLFAKIAAVLCMLVTVGVGQMWGADATMTGGSNATAVTVNTKSGFKCGTSKKAGSMSITVPTGATSISFYISGWGSDATIVSVEPTAKVNTTSITPSVDGCFTGNSTTFTTNSSESTYACTITLNSITTSTDITFSGGSGKRFIVWGATYSSGGGGCTSNPTVTAGSNSSVTATSATVSCTSGISSLGSAGCSISSYGFVIGTSANPSIGGSGVTQHEVGTTYTTTDASFSQDLTGLTASTHYYVRPYATNGNGTAYGSQTDFTTSALPKYTVTFDPGNGVCGTASSTEANAGDGVTLPSATHACGAWTLAGWATATCSETTTAPTLYAAGSTYHPTSNVTLYAVYKKAGSGGGSDSEELTESEIQSHFTTASHTYAGDDVSYTDGDVTWNAKYNVDAANRPWIQFNGSAYLQITAPGQITRVDVVVTSTSNKAGGITDKTQYNAFGSAVTLSLKPTIDGSVVGSSTTATTGSYQEISINVSSGTNNQLYLTPSGGYRLWGVEVYYNTVTYTYNSNPTCSGPELSASKLAVNFGTQNINTETDEPLTISGVNLTANATLTLGGANAAMFAVTPTSLTPTAGAISDADNVTVTYTPTAAGTHNATLTISSTGASDVVINLTGTCAIVCTTPTLSFEEETVYKYQGDGTFKNPLTVSGNALNAAVTYSSDNTSCAEVAADGTVTIVNANTSGGSVRITATIAAANNGVSCQNSATRYYTLVIKNKVTWYVNNDEYTDGAVTEAWESGTIANLPDTPDGESMCGGKTFIGWTTSAGDWDDTPPTPLYKTASAIPAISANAEFYAVFATAEDTGGESWELITDLSSVTEGTYALVSTDDYAFSGSISSGHGQATSSAFSFSANVAASAPTGTCELTLTAVTGGFTMYNATLGYLYATKAGSGGLAWHNSESSYWYWSSTYSNWMYDYNDAYLRAYDHTIRTYANNSGSALRLAKKSSISYSNYSTSCGTCLPAPNPVSVTPRSNGATLTWSAVPDATGYTVTCKQGSTPIDPANITIVGTTATITGLSSETTYNYTIQSTGTTPYTCFPTKKGSFTTADCDDVPVLGAVTTDASTATITWTCSAATATVQVFRDEACTRQFGGDSIGKTSPLVIRGLTSDTIYYYKVKSGGTCSSAVGSFTTEKIQMDVAEWRDTAVVISFNGDATATLTTYGEVSHGKAGSNVADSLFFSKYFEADGSNKMIAIFNGTSDTINLSNYRLDRSEKSMPDKKLELSYYGRKKAGYIAPREEIIIMRYTSTADPAKDCAKDQEGYDDWYDETSSGTKRSDDEVAPNSFLNFSGPMSIGLYSKTAKKYIDVIGATTKADGTGKLVQIESSNTDRCSYAMQSQNDKPGGFYCTKGDNARTEAIEDTCFISTNRCLLIRNNKVKSGLNSVAKNVYATQQECSADITQAFVTLAADSNEWRGYMIGNDAHAADSTCTGMAYVGTFDYDSYYTTMDTVKQEKTFEDMKSDPFDGTYVIPVKDLDTLACKSVRIELKDGSGNLIITKDFKVPIMVYDSKATTSEIFNNYGKTPATCATCDVVVMKDAVLTKAADGTTNDVPAVRNLEVYPGGKLVIPSGAGYNYTVNSLALRREGENISMLDVQGGLTVNKSEGVSLDLRIDPQDWHFVALPFACNVDHITYSDGTPAVLGTDYYLMWYDGAERAANKSGGWKSISAGTTIAKGMGFIVGLPDNPNGNIKESLRFPMANDVIADEKTNKTITGVKAHGGDQKDEDLTPNHKGWNLIGNPYMMYYATDYTTPLMVGELVEDGEGSFIRSGSARYLVTPNGWNGRNGYSQVAISTHMKPFTAYFVQIGGADNATGGDDPDEPQSIIFTQSSAGKTSIIRRSAASYEEVDNHPVWFGIELYSPNGQHDETTLLMSDEFTDNYDIMDDLVKLRSKYYKSNNSPLLATRNNKEELAFNALPDSSAEVVGVPVNYYAAQAGYHTIALNGMYRLDEVKEAKLYDATTGKYHDLLTDGNYEFNTAKGDNNSRFTLFVRVERKQSQVTTDNDNILANGELSLTAVDKTLLLSGLTEQAEVYVYDMSGKLLTSDRANGNGAVWRAHVPATGVYFVRVNGAQGQQTLRTIVK